MYPLLSSSKRSKRARQAARKPQRPLPVYQLRQLKRRKREPNIPELLKIDTPILICIKHSYHHLYRMRIETREIAVDQRITQLPLRQPACASSIDCFEKREERRIGAAANRGWCPRWSRWRRRTPLKSLWWRTEAVVLGRRG